MPPRKPTAVEGEEPTPRRSTRISSQPVTEEPKVKKPKAIAKPAAKRSAEDDGTKSTTKKVRSSTRLLSVRGEQSTGLLL